jgi:hypothetical protein
MLFHGEGMDNSFRSIIVLHTQPRRAASIVPRDNQETLQCTCNTSIAVEKRQLLLFSCLR